MGDVASYTSLRFRPAGDATDWNLTMSDILASVRPAMNFFEDVTHSSRTDLETSMFGDGSGRFVSIPTGP